MTVEKEHGGYVVCCDSCSDYVDVDSPTHDWDDVKQAIDQERYRATLVRGVWKHTCPSCQDSDDNKDGGGMPDETW